MENRSLPQTRFANGVDETLVCAICLFVPHPNTAVQHKPCDHIVCGPCISQWLQRKDECPKCRGPAANQLRPVKTDNRLLYRLMSSFMVHCDHWTDPHEQALDNKIAASLSAPASAPPASAPPPVSAKDAKENKDGGSSGGASNGKESKDGGKGKEIALDYSKGCETVVPWDRLPFHLNDEEKGCLFHQIPCQYCAVRVARGLMPHHLTICPKRKVNCTHCNQPVPLSDLQTHEQTQCSRCPTTIISCPFVQQGCKATFRRADEEKHIQESLFQHFKYLMIANTALETKNAELEFRVSQLSSTVDSLNRKIGVLNDVSLVAVPSMCIADGRGMKYANVNKQASFVVTLRDKLGRPVESQGEVVFADLRCTDEKHDYYLRASVTPSPPQQQHAAQGGDKGGSISPGPLSPSSCSYVISYTPAHVGTYSLSVTVNGGAIAGSPFVVHVGPAGWLLSLGGQSQILHPNGIHFDIKNELIMVCEYGAHRVQLFRPDGTSVRKIGSNGHGDGQLNCPQACCFDVRTDQIFVCDQGNQRICVFRPDGTFVRKWGSYGTTDYCFYNPLDCALDSRHDLIFITDHNNNRVVTYRTDGTFVRKFGHAGTLEEGRLNGPCCIALDTNHDVLYVSDYSNHRICVFRLDGTFVKKFGSHGSGDAQLNYPRGIAYDHRTDLVYVTEQSNNRVSVFRSDGVFIKRFGKYGVRCGEFSSPNSITIDPVNNCIYTSEYYNHRIQGFASLQ